MLAVAISYCGEILYFYSGNDAHTCTHTRCQLEGDLSQVKTGNRPSPINHGLIKNSQTLKIGLVTKWYIRPCSSLFVGETESVCVSDTVWVHLQSYNCRTAHQAPCLSTFNLKEYYGYTLKCQVSLLLKELWKYTEVWITYWIFLYVRHPITFGFINTGHYMITGLYSPCHFIML